MDTAGQIPRMQAVYHRLEPWKKRKKGRLFSGNEVSLTGGCRDLDADANLEFRTASAGNSIDTLLLPVYFVMQS